VNSNSAAGAAGNEDYERYCRELEAYLCRKNDGHLIRIVGPAFEQVCAWAARGVPLTLAMRGVDRYFDRYHAKGPRRRPVRIEFCEADVLDVFGEWKRSVGVPPELDSEAAEGNSNSLPAHVERVIARLTMLRGGADRSMDAVFDEVVREMDAARASARTVRGDARETMIARLQELDDRVVEALRQQTGTDTLQELERQAEEELQHFRSRMPADAYAASRVACVNRLLRERAGLPAIAYG
jgi:hypothetical protein